MLRVNESVTGFDLGELLHGEAGLFEAIAPGGDKFQCVARAGHSITNLRPLGESRKANALTWRVPKIGKLRSDPEPPEKIFLSCTLPQPPMTAPSSI